MLGGEKLNHYMQCPTLQAVLVVSHRRHQVSVISRNGEAWDTREYRSGQRVEVVTLSLSFAVDELYAGVTLDEA